MVNSILFTYELQNGNIVFKDENGTQISTTGTHTIYNPLLIIILDSIKKLNENIYDTIKYTARIIFHEDKAIKEVDKHYLFGQDYFLNDNKVPIIHLSHFNLTGDDEKLENPCRYSNIVDNSIWNYFIRIDSKTHEHITNPSPEESDTNDNNLYESLEKSKELILEGLTDTLDTITANYNDTLYKEQDAKDYANLNARLTQEAYINKPENRTISPFVFHSEKKIRESLGNIKNIEKLEKIRNEKWRFLLIADYKMQLIIEKRIKELINTETKGNENEVIVRDANFYYHSPNITNNTHILIDYVNSIDRGLELLIENKYDIILLDYVINQKEFGYQIFEKSNYFKSDNPALENTQNDPTITIPVNKDSKTINYSTEKIYKKGPTNKFFFFFFSPYTSAVFERLSAEDIDSVDEDWRISVGACPINTPQLFSYNLMRFMYRRLEDTGILELQSQKIYDILSSIFSDPKKARSNAGKKYPDILDLQYSYRHMLNDVDFPNTANKDFDTKESVLISSFISDRVNLGGMLEHLAQLVHLTAFGTVRQWPEMWEEYMYFKSQFNEQYIYDSSKVDEKVKQTLQNLYNKIEEYILQLKKHQQ